MDPTKDVKTNTAATAPSGADVAKNGYHSTEDSPVFHYFLKLPAEIRSEIYREFAACDESHSLNLFNTSKQMRNEGAEASARHYMFRLCLGWYPVLEAALDLKATPVIQHVYLVICLDGVGKSPNLAICLDGVRKSPRFMPLSIDCKWIEYFGGSQVMRESCLIVLRYGFTGYLSKTCASTTLFKTLRQLTNFRSVTVEIEFMEDTNVNDHSSMIRNIRKPDLYAERVKVALEPALGPVLGPTKVVGRFHQAGRGFVRVQGREGLLFHPFEWKSRIDQQSDLA